MSVAVKIMNCVHENACQICNMAIQMAVFVTVMILLARLALIVLVRFLVGNEGTKARPV